MFGRRARYGAWIATLVVTCAIVASTAPVASAAETITIASVTPVIFANAGDTANVSIKLTFTGSPNTGFTGLDRDLTVTWTVGGTYTVGTSSPTKSVPSTAVAGVDYTSPTTGTVTFPANSASGTTLTFPVVTAPNASPSLAKTINTSLACTTGCTGASVTSYTNDPSTVVVNAHGFPYLDPSQPIATRVSDLMSHMTLADKIGQMTETIRDNLTSTTANSNTGLNNVRAWELGSLLSGGGSVPSPNTPTGWADMVDNFERRVMATPLQIPLIYGQDTVHGVNNMVGATIFPHNIGMGATRDPALAEQEGEVVASETRTSGAQWGFSPCICVARDDRWGRTYESYSEDPALVSLLETVIDGMQGTAPTDKGLPTHMLATAKHFAGDGGTTYGTGSSGYPIDQGTTQTTRALFQSLYVAPYIPAVQVHHVGSIMPSYSSVQYTDAPAEATATKMSARGDLLTTDLKGTLGFDGFLISDYDALNAIPDTHTADGVADAYSDQIMKSFNAGMDIDMAAGQPEYKNFENDLTTLVGNGKVAQSRIDDAVSRILTQKFELGLFEHPYTDRSNQSQIDSAAHKAIARQAVSESQVLLKNAGGLLPLSKTPTKVYVAGSNADNLGNQMGGWTLSWQGGTGTTADAAFGTTIRTAIAGVVGSGAVTYSATASPAPTSAQGYNYGIVVVGEHPYAEGQGDVGFTGSSTNGNISSLNLSTADSTAVTNVCNAMPCVVLVVSGRPMTLTPAQFNLANAVVASWLPGTEGAGVTDVLFGDKPFTGRLPMTWPRTLSQEPINVGDPTYDPAFPFGWGLRTGTGFSTKSSLQAARNALAGISGDINVTAAVAALDAILGNGDDWTGSGAVSDPGAVLRGLQTAANDLAATTATSFTQNDGVVSAARDIAEAAVVRGGGPSATTSPLIANADDALLNSHPDTAVTLLTQASGDVTPPTSSAALSPSPVNGWYAQNPTVTLTADDGGGVGGGSIQYELDGAASWTTYGGPFVVTGDGPHHLVLRAIDGNGNTETAHSIDFQTDTTLPTVSASLSPPPVGGYYVNPTVTISASDAGSGVALVEDNVDGAGWVTYPGSFPVTGDGPHTVQFRATDVAGNVKSDSVSFLVDATAPSTSSSAPCPSNGSNGWCLAAVQVTLSASDATSGVPAGGTQYAIDGGSWTPYTGPFTISADGDHVVQYMSTDNAGNVEVTQSIHVKVDQTDPTSSSAILPAEQNGWYGAPTVTLTGADGTGSGIAQIAYKMEGELSWHIHLGAGPVSLSGFTTGNHLVQFYATDNAGRVESPAHLFAFKVDAAPPAVTIQSPVDGSVYPLGKAVLAKFKCVEPGSESGVASCLGSQGATPLNPTGTVNVDTSTIGAHSISVTGIDKAGNSATTTSGYTVQYTWNGFVSPVGNESDSILNVVHAGDIIKIKFGLGAETALGVATGSWSTVSCSAYSGWGLAAVGGSAGTPIGLSYGVVSPNYAYGVDTSGWANTCRRFSLQLNDGTPPHTAVFSFFP